MSKLRLCIHCKHHSTAYEESRAQPLSVLSAMPAPKLVHFCNNSIDPITGAVSAERCGIERYFNGSCGRDALLFEPKGIAA